MQMLDGALVHSASDLNAYTECLHLTALERAVAAGTSVRPQRDDPTAALLARKGDEHERRHLARLRETYGDRLVAFEERPVATRSGYAAAEAAGIAAMAQGADVIYQATFFDGTFLGRADFLRRVERPSRRWAWSYEVVDTKLALSPKPYFLVQLCNYSEHVTRIQGSAPERAAIVLGTGEERSFALAEYAAYYRRLKAAYLTSVERGDDAYPFECAHCDLCAWRDDCVRKRERDDHLSLVAGIRRDQIAKLEAVDVATLAALAHGSDEARPQRLVPETYGNLRGQAAEQHRYRVARSMDAAATHSYSFREPADPSCGFARLPKPAAGDIFFDIEGDPLYRPDRALEYLFGVYLPDEDAYRPFWGTTPADERTAFEGLVDFVVARRKRYPDLHVYHYASYETSALKRLMGRFASREDEIDDFLRAGTFVDLFPIVRQSVWISQPSYSIKKVEALYGFERSTTTKGGDDSIVMFESWLETQDAATLEDIRAYNEDDCRSTAALRDWLVRLRAERNATLAGPVAWRTSRREPETQEPVQSDGQLSGALAVQLLDGLTPPDTPAELQHFSEPLRARWLLGNLLQYHRREQKPAWWEFFHRCEHPDTLVDEDRKAIGGLHLRTDIAPHKVSENDRNYVHTYEFPSQEHEMEVGSEPADPATGKSAGKIVALDGVARTIAIKLKGTCQPESLRALIPPGPLPIRNHREAMETIAQAYLDGSLERDHPATLGLLLARVPQLRDRRRGSMLQPGRVTRESVADVVRALERSYLVIQGPPGSGKSTIGAHAIVDLLMVGKRVALAAQSHKALHNLLRKVEENAAARGFAFAGCHKSSSSNAGSAYEAFAVAPMITDAPTVAGYEGCTLVSSTTYSWADARQRGAFDVVVIDEAGQISLADALIASLIAHDVVLLGDPQQLPQVSQGSHPLGTDRSILEHLLGNQRTIAPERGVFLDTSYRMHPDIDGFVSRAFYDGRLHADEANVRNRLVTGSSSSAGLRYVDVHHDGNARFSLEEAQRIVTDIAALVRDAMVTVRNAAPRRLRTSDVLVVAPYNMQRAAIEERLRCAGLGDVRVGTVDKFQGQEAPVVFYSMATSSAELAPRGLAFLLSPNRLNVAVSRAQVLSVVVCSPHLLASRATSIEAMRLLNLLCSYVEEVDRSAEQVTLSA